MNRNRYPLLSVFTRQGLLLAAVARGSVRIPGFYQEWALPTSRLAALLLALAGLAAAFPYIPGSDSRLFQVT